jgi:hypothetical protein
MTVNDLLDNFEIQGALRVQRWNEETEDMDVFYDSDDHENALVNRGYEWLQSEIKYMYPSTTENRNDIEIPQIVIEIE